MDRFGRKDKTEQFALFECNGEGSIKCLLSLLGKWGGRSGLGGGDGTVMVGDGEVMAASWGERGGGVDWFDRGSKV